MIALQHNNPNNHQTQQIPEYELDAAKEEAASRHQDIASGLLSELRYWLGFLDDLLSCDIRNWNVRLCEYIMRDVIVDTVLLNWNRSLESLETDSSSKLSLMKKSEELLAKAQIRASVNFITQVMGMVEYVSANSVFPAFMSFVNLIVYLCSATSIENGSSSVVT
jgi:hypothetical protein